MNPSHSQLKGWLAVHNIEMGRSAESLVLTAYTCPPPSLAPEVITRVRIEEKVPVFQDEREDLARLEKACNTMAWELCLVPPRVALALNHKAYRQCNATT